MLSGNISFNYNMGYRAFGKYMKKTQSDKRFRALIEKSADAILIVDTDAKITYANGTAGEMLGYENDTFLKLSIYDLVHPQERAYLAQQFDRAKDRSESSKCELRLKCYDGSWLWTEATITNLFDDPEVESIYLNLRDITGRKEAYYNLESQKDLLQNLVVIARATSEAAELGDVLQNLLKIGKYLTQADSGSVFVFDEIGAVAYTRSFYSRLDPERVQDLMDKGLTGWVIQRSRPALVTDTVADGRWLELATNGYTPRSAVAIPIFNGQDILAILVLTHAKTGHFNTGHLKTLQAASGQMAMAIHNARLYTERRKLEQQREELTDMIVHDLRNPASAISGIVEMLKSLKELGDVPDDFDEMMKLAERNVNKILDLVQEILDVSQLENGQLPIEKKAIDISALIDEALQLQQPIVSMKGMRLENRTDPHLPPVLADERLIRRVLQNLIDNASKFSRRDSDIIVYAKMSAENPDMVQVSVRDFGVGIPAEIKGHIFEKFVRDRNAKRGTGIGLTFCKLAVMAQDGRIWADSEENNGSTFHFTLPVAEE